MNSAWHNIMFPNKLKVSIIFIKYVFVIIIIIFLFMACKIRSYVCLVYYKIIINMNSVMNYYHSENDCFTVNLHCARQIWLVCKYAFYNNMIRLYKKNILKNDTVKC